MLKKVGGLLKDLVLIFHKCSGLSGYHTGEAEGDRLVKDYKVLAERTISLDSSDWLTGRKQEVSLVCKKAGGDFSVVIVGKIFYVEEIPEE